MAIDKDGRYMKKRFEEDMAMMGAGTLTGVGVAASATLAASGRKQGKKRRIAGGGLLFLLSLFPAAIYTLISYVDTEDDIR